ncbi:MAG TPA: hypothetical protein VF503_25610 [Sphingobium sp.]|uniref:glycine zipper domain-containing protein n=1 Tax=Sphingobium sp. TaxID=1912891 RepID=UPI002ED37453
MTDTPPEGSADAASNPAQENSATRIGSFVSEHPLATAASAIAVGAVIGMLLPRWKVTASAGSAVSRTAGRAAKVIAAAETTRTLLAGLSAATGSVKAGAHRIAEHVPDADTVKAGAKRALERAGETAQKAGEQVAQAARRIKAGED